MLDFFRTNLTVIKLAQVKKADLDIWDLVLRETYKTVETVYS